MTVDEEIMVDLVDLSGEDIIDVARNGDSLILIKGMVEVNLVGRLLEAEDLYSTTILHIIAARNEVESANLLFEKTGLKLLNKANKEGNTPLHWASLTGNLDMIKLLVAKGAEISVENEMGKSPLCEVPLERQDIITFYESVLGPCVVGEVNGQEEGQEEILMNDPLHS